MHIFREGRQAAGRALTFIQVWKVRSLTSRSFWRAPASSAQGGRRASMDTRLAQEAATNQ